MFLVSTVAAWLSVFTFFVTTLLAYLSTMVVGGLPGRILCDEDKVFGSLWRFFVSLLASVADGYFSIFFL